MQLSRIEQLAYTVGMLSQKSLNELAEILVKDYPDRADSLQNFLCWAEFDNKADAQTKSVFEEVA